MPLGAKYAISRDRFLILNPLKQLSARKTYQYPSIPCTTFIHRARSTGMNSVNSSSKSSAAGDVLARLLSSNSRWAADVASSHPSFFSECAQGQQPQVLWIGCSDSRVPESVITACKPGELFTHRNIANQFPVGDVSAESVLEYAVNFLGVNHVVVAGHTNCGGAAAALDIARTGESLPDHATSLQKWLVPLVQRVRAMSIDPNVPHAEALMAVVKENVAMQIENICKTNVIKNVQRPIHIHGWVYGLADGQIQDLQLTRAINGAI